MGDGAGFLAYGRHVIDEDDIAAVARVLRGDWLTQGPTVAAFEDALALRVGAPHAVACANGTAALHLAMLALGLGPGDAAIVPSMTFLATANCVRYVGAEVVFADVDAHTGLMGPEHLDQALGRAGDLAVKAVLPVHLNGQCVDVGVLDTIARPRGIAIVEDGCHALGASLDGDPVGACRHSAMTAFSFHPVKAVAMGEGGALTTRDPALDARLRRLRSHGILRDPALFTNPDLALAADGTVNPWYTEMPDFGFNYRVSDINCALGLSQLGKLDRFLAKRAELVARYHERLVPLAPLVRMLDDVSGCRPGWHLMVALIDFAAAGRDRAQVMGRMKDRGIGSQVHYLPVHLQPYYRQRYDTPHLPGAMAYYRRCLSLPLFPAMDPGDVDRVVDALAEALGPA